MRSHLLPLIAALAVPATATIEFFFHGSANPLPAAEAAAQTLILKAMGQAIQRWDRLVHRRTKTLTILYDPSVPTANGHWDDYRTGTIRFGPDKQYMTEHVALHEIAHTLGIGRPEAGGHWFFDQCAKDNWARARALLKQWHGDSYPKIVCGQGEQQDHFTPYGMNDASEATEENMDRHVLLVDAMVRDMGLGPGEPRVWTA